MEDADKSENVSYLVLTNRGIYYALRTLGGNYILKTYISTSMGLKEIKNYQKGKYSKWEREGELLDLMVTLHQYYNKQLYDKDILEHDLYTVIKKGEELERKENSPLILLRN